MEKIIGRDGKNESSTVVDKDGQTIAKLGDERKKEKCDIRGNTENLKNAYISIEDERFYKHSGIDTKERHQQYFLILYILDHHHLEEVL